MSKVVVQDLTAGYVPGVNILQEICFTVEEREILTIIGPNGSGKSTLLKSMMGYVVPTAGTVVVSGDDCTRVTPHRRVREHRMAFVPQLANVFGPMTIRDNLRAGAFGLSRRRLEERVEELLDRYQTLGDRCQARADSLSGGERQMLAVCRALMSKPDVLLLDEPSAGLSPAKVTELFDELVKVRDHDDITIVCVEQNAVQSLEVSDRGVVLVQGEVALEGSADQLLDDPQVRDLYLGGLGQDCDATPDIPSEETPTQKVR
jgi:branched-chain amino acid transport system ATP-binding protein